MRQARFWTAIAILMGPPLGWVLYSYAHLLAPWPSVRGRVMYQDRPVRGGGICLASADRVRSSDMIGEIDHDGYFECRPTWWLDRPDPAHYRILLYPDPRRRRAARPEATRARPTAAAPSGASPARRLGARILLASHIATVAGAVPPAPWQPAATPRPGAPARLEFSLEREPVFLSIDLNK